jgi:hypothetical protein
MIDAGYIRMSGSLFLKDLNGSGYVDITYDRDIIIPGEQCPPPDDEEPPPDDEEPPPECFQTCNETCGDSACIDGHCAPCTADADCCDPYVCIEGACRQLI